MKLISSSPLVLLHPHKLHCALDNLFGGFSRRWNLAFHVIFFLLAAAALFGFAALVLQGALISHPEESVPTLLVLAFSIKCLHLTHR